MADTNRGCGRAFFFRGVVGGNSYQSSSGSEGMTQVMNGGKGSHFYPKAFLVYLSAFV